MRTLKYLTLVLWLTASAAETDDNFAGVGVVLGVDGQHIIIRKILPDSPAATQPDLHIGDRITAIAQDKEAAVQVQKGDLRRALGLIRGPKGTTVRLTIMPLGEDNSHVRVVSFVRAEIKELAGSGDGVLLTNGTKAPDIEMVRLADKAPERLSDYTDKIIVLEFWATWCGPCQPKMADLQQYYGQYPDWRSNVVLIAASVDDTEDIATKHLKAKGWDQTHNVWVGTHAKKAYHIDGIPTAYVIDRQGKIVAANPLDVAEIVNHECQRGQATGAK